MAKGRKTYGKRPRPPPCLPKAIGNIVDGGSDAKEEAFRIHVGQFTFGTVQQLNKTISDLITIIERNAKKLSFFDKDYTHITSLQLASKEDDNEREDLELDLTLGDLSVRMEGKHLVAVAKSNNPTPPPPAAISTTDSAVAPIAKATHTSDFSIGAPLAPADVAPNENFTFLHSHKPCLPAPKDTSSRAESQTSQIGSVDTGCSFHADSDDGNGQSTTPDAQVAMAKSGAMATHGGGSSAKQDPPCLPSLIVTMESSSDPHPVHQSPNAEPSKTVPLARVHVDPSGAMVHTKQFRTAEDCSHDDAAAAAENGYHPEIAKAELLGNNIHDNQGESPSAASEHVPAATAPSSGIAIDSHHSEDPTAILVKRSIETGEEVTPVPIPVKLSDLSPYFHLNLACAAEELDVPKSEFKKLCKNLGLKRWPSCKVRTLQKAIERLELKIAEGGQTVQVEAFANRLNFLKECYDKLLHGTVAQMNTVVDSRAVLLMKYPRLYAAVLRSGDECQRCHGLINIQSNNANATQECVRLDDKFSATEHSTRAQDTASENSNAEPGLLSIRRGREARFDDERVVGMHKGPKDIIMVADEGTKGCTCCVVISGIKWYPHFEREGPWLCKNRYVLVIHKNVDIIPCFERDAPWADFGCGTNYFP